MFKRKRMAKLVMTALLGGSLLALSACGQKGTETGAQPPASASPGAASVSPSAAASASPSAKPSQAPEAKGAAAIYAKSIEGAAKLESFSVSMNIKQNIEQGGNKTDMTSKLDMDVVMKPEQTFKQVMSTNMMGQDIKMEMYFVKDGFFMKDMTSGTWMKLPQEQMNAALQGASEEQLDPSKQLDKLKAFTDDMELTESGDAYTIKLNASGDKFNDFIKNELKNSGNAEQMDALVGAMSGMKVNKMAYTFTIDKKNYFPKAMTVDMDMEMDIQGQKISMVQSIDGTYSNYNSVKEIVVPKEALESAKSVQ
ncbi:DUF6612 family protein [Paenibacillus contaminans]|uniref:LppX_LprAFG lipoprotein n=1 Tax=Paenibacillus contaminans TaxID=450362 RepID=A0A329LNB5_9BACL|nr:DUF6612 family protein [Paenibacillus contaminans]RAV09394.1 hypothetical protein DQG23_39525 [Paenibacillus contaminans]